MSLTSLEASIPDPGQVAVSSQSLMTLFLFYGLSTVTSELPRGILNFHSQSNYKVSHKVNSVTAEIFTSRLKDCAYEVPRGVIHTPNQSGVTE